MASKPKSNTNPLQDSPFQPGFRVEISSDDDGFRGSWFLGTDVRRKSINKFIVEYDTIFADEAGKKHLKETLDQTQLRPVAPREKDRVFEFGEEVDAYHNDGWWEGTITEDCGGGRFKVFFRSSREQIEFENKDLRLHREWINGEWKPPLEIGKVDLEKKKEEVPITAEVKSSRKRRPERLEPQNKGNTKKLKPIEGMGGGTFSKGMLVEVSSDEDGFKGAWFAATVVKALGKDKYLIEYKNLKTEDDTGLLQEEADHLHIRPTPPERIVVDRFRLQDEVDAMYNDGWWVGIITKLLSDSKYSIYFKDTEEEIVFKHSQLRLHQDWINGKWVMTSQALNL